MHDMKRNASRSAVSAGLLVCLSMLPAATAQVTIHPLLTTGLQAPGAPSGSTFTTFSQPVINSLGQVAFKANLSTGGNGIWSNSTGNVELFARTGTPVPGIANSSYFNLLGPLLAENGEVSITGIWTVGTPSSQRHGVVRGMPGASTVVAQQYGKAPGLSPNAYFDVVSTRDWTGSVISSPAMNASGRVSFYAKAIDLQGGGEVFGIWSDSNGTLEPIVHTDMAVPGYPGARFSHIGSSGFDL